MPRRVLSPKPAVKRQSWDKQKMQDAVKAVREKKIGLKKAAKQFLVPKTTLRRLVLEVNSSPAEVVTKKLGRKPALPPELECQLVEYLQYMEARYYGFTLKDVRNMAYQLAVRNGIESTFRNFVAGRSWLDHFLRRHPNLSVRKPTGTSLARAKGFTRERVNAFYDLLESEFKKCEYPADRIWNVDETGLSIVQTKIPQVIACKGKRQVASLTAAERGSLVTVVCSMSAGGSYVPPLMIFPRVNMTDTLLRGAPPGTIGRAHPSGWIQSNLFTDWLNHFIEKTKPTESSPILLILDGHVTHTKNIDVIDTARNNHISIITLPSHTTHKLQPLDRTFMGALKTHYSENIRQWMMHENKPLGPYDIAFLFGKAYLRSTVGNTAVKGFKVTGIFPLDRNIFSDADFIASEQEIELTTPAEDQNAKETNLQAVRPVNNSANVSSVAQSVNSTNVRSVVESESSSNSKAQPRTFLVSPKDIHPAPTKIKRSNRGRKPLVASLITGSPYKADLLEAINKREEAKGKRGRGRGCRAAKNIQRNLFNNPQPGTSGTPRQTKKRGGECRRPGRGSRPKIDIQDSSDSGNEIAENENMSTSTGHSPLDLPVGEKEPDDSNAACMFCDLQFTDDHRGELWIQCVMCSLWAHNECAGAEQDIYVCDFCK